MLKRPVAIFIISAFFICDSALIVNAQSKLNSPYSNLGLGRLNDNGNVSTLAYGGLGAALRNKREINFLNPASITSLVVTTYEAGLSGTFLTVSENGLSNKSALGTLEYVSLTFPLTLKKVGGATGIGLRRLNNIGYGITENALVDSVGSISYLYEGEGGINRLNLT
ncbi:MAG: hypothetical protein IH948_10810, partial [Bacteroidetes bacterium]|nr:hypothetical protein [Bacteroidota bacterium]